MSNMNTAASASFPDSAEVVVIGGGVMGCSTLYHLGVHGIRDAVLLERSALTSGTSWHSAALVRGLRASENLTRLIRYSQQLYKKLEEETGQSTGWIGKGSLSIATRPERLVHLRRQETLSHLFGIEAQSVSPAEAKSLWPMLNEEDVLGAVFSPEDGRVGVSDLCAALVKGAKAAGQRIFENTEVEGIELSGGRVVGVRTARGRIRCEKVVVCCGLWSRELLEPAGVNVPLWPCEHFYLLTKPIAELSGNIPTLFDYDAALYIRDDSGGMLVGSFELNAKAISPQKLGKDFAFQLLEEDWDHFEPMLESAIHRVPALARAEAKTLLNGPESFVADGMFMLGETAGTPGLYLGCGMNSVGVATSGGAGNALAYCLAHGRMPFALHEADPNRFPDCFQSAQAVAARAPEVLGHVYDIPFPGWQPKSARGLRHLPLHECWQRYDPHWGQHYGFERPLYFNRGGEPALTFSRPAWFAQVGDEVRCATEHAAMFELSQLGKIVVEGRDATALLGRVCSGDMTKRPGRVVYTSILDAAGGIISDLTVHRLDENRYMMYVDADSIVRDICWLQQHRADGEDVEVRDETARWAVLGLFGAKALDAAMAAGADGIGDISYFGCADVAIGGCPVRAARLSFAGEAGWELTCAAADAPAVFEALEAAGARPAGAYALASMRIEKRFLALHADLDCDVTPLDADLDFAVAMNSDFIGKEKLLSQQKDGCTFRFVLLVLDNPDATLWGNEMVSYQNKIIGRTTSAAHGYRINRPVAIALVRREHIADAEDGFAVSVRIGGDTETARAHFNAAYDARGARVRNV